MTTPKETFLASPHKDAWSKQTETAAFQAACDYALLEMLQRIASPPTPQDGWDSTSQLSGAKRVIDILKRLATPDQKPVTPKAPTLKYP